MYCSRCLAQSDDFAHVDFVERGEQGGGVLRFDQALRNALANGAHHHVFFLARVAGGDEVGGRLRAGQIGFDEFDFGLLNGLRCHRRGATGTLVDGALDVFFERAAARAGRFDRFGSNSFLRRQPLGRGHHAGRGGLRLLDRRLAGGGGRR